MKKIVCIFVLVLLITTTVSVVGQEKGNNADKWVKTFDFTDLGSKSSIEKDPLVALQVVKVAQDKKEEEALESHVATKESKKLDEKDAKLEKVESLDFDEELEEEESLKDVKDEELLEEDLAKPKSESQQEDKATYLVIFEKIKDGIVRGAALAKEYIWNGLLGMGGEGIYIKGAGPRKSLRGIIILIILAMNRLSWIV